MDASIKSTRHLNGRLKAILAIQCSGPANWAVNSKSLEFGGKSDETRMFPGGGASGIVPLDEESWHRGLVASWLLTATRILFSSVSRRVASPTGGRGEMCLASPRLSAADTFTFYAPDRPSQTNVRLGLMVAPQSSPKIASKEAVGSGTIAPLALPYVLPKLARHCS